MDLNIKEWRSFYFESILEFKLLKEAEDYQARGYIKFNQDMPYYIMQINENLWTRWKGVKDIETSHQLEMSDRVRNDTADIILVHLDSSDDNLLYDLYAYPPEGVGNEVKYWFNVKQVGTGWRGNFMKTKYINLPGLNNFKDPQGSRNSLHEINAKYDIWYRPKQNTQVQTGGKTRIRKNPHTKKLSKEVS